MSLHAQARATAAKRYAEASARLERDMASYFFPLGLAEGTLGLKPHEIVTAKLAGRNEFMRTRDADKAFEACKRMAEKLCEARP